MKRSHLLQSFPPFTNSLHKHPSHVQQPCLLKRQSGCCSSYLQLGFADEDEHLSRAGEELLAKFALGAHIQIHVCSGVAEAQHGAHVRRYVQPSAVIILVYLVHVSGAEEDLCDGPCDGKQHETHGDGHEEHDGFPLPKAQQWGYFGDDVALQSLQPNHGVDEKRQSPVVVCAYGLVVLVD